MLLWVMSRGGEVGLCVVTRCGMKVIGIKRVQNGQRRCNRRFGL